jgi:hypothetical protein
MSRIPIDFSELARIEIPALDIEITEEEILADLAYPAPSGAGWG